MSELYKMLRKTIKDNGNFVSKEQATKYLEEFGRLLIQKDLFKDAAKEWMEMHDVLKDKYEPYELRKQ